MKRFLLIIIAIGWISGPACAAVSIEIIDLPVAVYANTPMRVTLLIRTSDGSVIRNDTQLQYRFSSEEPYQNSTLTINEQRENGSMNEYTVVSYLTAGAIPGNTTLQLNALDSEVASTSVIIDAPVVLEGARLTVGYQGWFGTPGDNALNRWNHWFEGNGDQQNPTQDLWPLVEEAEYPDRKQTDLVTNDGSSVYLYSNAELSTANTHVSWMKQYGLQAFFVGRFLEPLTNSTDFASFRNTVMQNMIDATQTIEHGGQELKFAIFYNLTTNPRASGDRDYLEELWEDWKDVVDNKRWTAERRYLKKDGKPVIRIYGIGYKNRPSGITAPEANDLLRRFTDPTHPEYRDRYQAYLVGGVPSKWNVGGNDAYGSAEWRAVYESYDMIQPWLVNRYQDEESVDRWVKNTTTRDLARVNELHAAGRSVGYLPLIFPGFSWYNLNGAYNVAPRNGGQFYWHQAYRMIEAGVSNLMIANFDEVDEGTAIYKCAVSDNQVPDEGQFSSTKKFLHYNSEESDGQNYPADWYLKVSREIRKMLLKVTPLTPDLPIVPAPTVMATHDKEIEKITTTLAKEETLYPNPTQDQLHVRVPDQDKTEVSIINTGGGTVLQQSLSDREPIDVSSLRPGIYLVKVQNDSRVTTRKLVIQR